MNKYYIETFTGKMVDPMHLDEELIDINDIAHSLSLLCRFLGHCLVFYSVAEHSILVANLVHKKRVNGVGIDGTLGAEATIKTCLAALLHDAAEAYIGDITRPLKHHSMFKQLPEVEQQILGKIMVKFNCTGVDWQLIEKADDIMVATEARHLMADSGKDWNLPEPALNIPLFTLTPEGAETMFLEAFENYGGKQ